MKRVLVVYEVDALGRVPLAARDLAHGADEVGANVRMHALNEAGVDDLRWADTLAFGIEGREGGLPQAAKHWLDVLGFSGWRALDGKRGCVFAISSPDNDSSCDACRALANRLSARGMDASTSAELGLRESMADGRAIGRRLASQWPTLHLSASIDARGADVR
jgi:hypothetical protein